MVSSIKLGAVHEEGHALLGESNAPSTVGTKMPATVHGTPGPRTQVQLPRQDPEGPVEMGPLLKVKASCNK